MKKEKTKQNKTKQTKKQTNKQKTDGFLLFLEAFSWETNLWVTLGDFYGKNKKQKQKQKQKKTP